ncbi:MAG: hypothetical protein ACKVJF_01810 [Flavobacteriales bacterium]
MNKIEIKNYLIQQEFAKVNQSDLNYSKYLCGNGRACDQVIDMGDEAQLNTRSEISKKLDEHAQIHEKKLEFLRNLSFHPTSIIELGAIVETDNIFLIISTPTKPFEYDNKQFVGVSINAPLYNCLEGKTIGEVCIYNDVKFVIKNIY